MGMLNISMAKRIVMIPLLALLLLLGGCGELTSGLIDGWNVPATETIAVKIENKSPADSASDPRDAAGTTTDPDEVAYYLWATGHLPDNYLTKAEAHDRGWDPEKGDLHEAAGQGAAIGGDAFGNREDLLPDRPERRWFECDVNYDGGYRGPERLVWSNDGFIYYTGDHYESFVLIFDPAEDDLPRLLEQASQDKD